MTKRWWRWLQWVGGALVIAFVTRFLIRNWAEIRAEPVTWRIAPGWIALSLALVLATYAVLIESWRRLLAGWGKSLAPPWLPAARIWVLSSMGKYLPGKVWSIAGMALLAQRRGVPPWAATASAILLQVASIGTGALIVALTGVASLEAHRPGSRVALLLILVLSLAALAIVLRPPPALARRLIARLGGGGGGNAEVLTPSAGALGFGVGANALAWSTYGIALWCLARGVLPDVGLPLLDAVAAFAGSYIAGLLFLLAPGGLGVREGVFVWMLQDRIGPANALALAAVSRIAMTVADVLAALPFALTRSERARDSA